MKAGFAMMRNFLIAELQQLNAALTFIRDRNALDYAITGPHGIG